LRAASSCFYDPGIGTSPRVSYNEDSEGKSLNVYINRPGTTYVKYIIGIHNSGYYFTALFFLRINVSSITVYDCNFSISLLEPL